MSARSIPTTVHPSPSRRFSQVYVQVPPSPFTRTSQSSRDTSEEMQKQVTTPLRVRNEEATPNGVETAQVKRKRSEHDLGAHEKGAMDSTGAKGAPKKRKLSGQAKPKTTTAKKAAKAKPATSNANEEYPFGFFYCHQCAKKRGLDVGLPCTFKTGGNHVDAQCKAKYCKACLKNRYGQDMDEIKEQSANNKAKETSGHVKGQGYYFKCPRCDGTCNCRACRKAHGLQPTGNLTLAARKSGADSVAKILEHDDKITGILPGKGKQVPDAPKKPRVPALKAPKQSKTAPAPSAAAKDAQPKPKRPYVRKPKPLPSPKWTSVLVPPSFTLDLASQRIMIREFIVRFAPLFDISRSHLEELEEIGGRRALDDDDEVLDAGMDVGVELGWVGETCARAILVALLKLIAENEGTKEAKKIFTDVIRDIKASGANLSRMWGVLATMRGALAEINPKEPALIFPDPLPPPATATVHTTRSGLQNSGGVQVSSTAQLVPVILILIEAVLSTPAVRQEMDEGVKEEKERAKDEKERVREERERWEVVRKGNPTKVERESHKHTLNALEQALRVMHHAYMPRLAPLGLDHEGRVYFALSPSVAEQEAAHALLSGDSKKGGKAKGRAVVSADERHGLRKWGWFVAVWGRRPEPEQRVDKKGKGKALKQDDDQENSGDENDKSERWWGFSEPFEVRNIAGWIAGKNGIAEGKGKDSTPDASAEVLVPKPEAHVPGGSRESTAVDDTDASSHNSSPLSDVSDDEMDVDDMSELSSLSEDEGDDGMRGMMRTDANGKPLPGRRQLKELVKGLQEYAEVLDWRMWRMQTEDVKDEKENDVKGKGKDKDKDKEKTKLPAVSAERFYS